MSSERSEVANNIMRHNYRQLSDADKLNMDKIKDAALAFWDCCESIGLQGAPDKSTGSRELSLAKTKIEEAAMWATKAITK